MLICHLQILFIEVCVSMFCPLLKWTDGGPEFWAFCILDACPSEEMLGQYFFATPAFLFLVCFKEASNYGQVQFFHFFLLKNPCLTQDNAFFSLEVIRFGAIPYDSISCTWYRSIFYFASCPIIPPCFLNIGF